MKRAAAAALLALSGPALASNVIYSIDVTDGTESITGTITTDGTLGALGASDLVSWSLTASGPVPGAVQPVAGGLGYGGPSTTVFTATPSALLPPPSGNETEFSQTVSGPGGALITTLFGFLANEATIYYNNSATVSQYAIPYAAGTAVGTPAPLPAAA